MSTYPGILIRNNLSDVGNIPRSGDWTGCPDIILAGQTMPNDPQATYASAAAYAKDFGGVVTSNNANYIYLRGKNLTGNDINDGMAYLFYANSGIVLNPQQWTTPGYRIWSVDKNGKPQDYADLPVKAGQVAATPVPFSWLNPPSPPPGEHFCLITMAGTADDVRKEYLAAQSVYDMPSLAAWIYNNGGTGWRNIQVVSAGAATMSVPTNYQNIGPEATIYLQLNCSNLPAGSAVGYSANLPANGTAVNLPATVVPPPPGGKNGDINPNWTVGMKFKFPANYSSPFSYQWYGNGYSKNSGFNITVMGLVVSNGNDALANHPVSFAQAVGNDAFHFHPKFGLKQGLDAFAHFETALGGPLDPVDPVNIPTAIAGSHTALVL